MVWWLFNDSDMILMVMVFLGVDVGGVVVLFLVNCDL
jgi:hypothetical protein